MPRELRNMMLFVLLPTATLTFTPSLLLRHSLLCLGTGRTSQCTKEHRSSTTTGLAVSNMGWDNEDFLEALNKGPEAVEKANAQYDRLKQFGKNSSNKKDDNAPNKPDLNEVDDPVAAALAASADEDEEESDAAEANNSEGPNLTAEQIEKVKQRNQEESNEGGQMFKKLLERAESGPKKDIPAYVAQPQTGGTPPPAQAEASSASPTANLPPGFEQLSPEAQAKVFLELMNAKTGGAASPPANTGPPPPPTKEMRGGVGPDGRKVGRNRDADAIVNSADVYFAQLKLDSSVRNTARYAGDDAKADSVFADPRIQDIQMHVNPHLEEQRQAEQALLETAQDEMILPEMFAPSPKRDPKNKGISYKEKLAQKKRTRLAPPAPGTPAAAAAAVPPPTVEETPAMKEQPPVKEEPKPEPVSSAAVASPPEPMSVAVEQPKAPAPPPAAVVAPPPPVVETPPAPAVVAPTPPAPKDTRGEIRTLMGLLLKHRGGPGFGSGRIQGAEREQFESLADSVLAKLKSEAIPDPPKAAAAPAVSAPAASATAVATPVPAPAAASGGAISPQPRIPPGDRVNSAITCVEGAIQMFQSSPPELQGGMLVALHAAIAAAASTLGDIVEADDAPASPSSAPPTPERINGAIACVQGAIQMYQSSPVPEAQGGMLLALHAAVAAAASTLGGMVNSEHDRQGTATVVTAAPSEEVVEDAVASASTSTADSPALSAPSSASGTDENTVFLEGVYEKLKRAAGPGKMGLRDDFQDAESLLDDLNKMRMLLVEELDTGIPESPSDGINRSNEGSAPSKYQEMLAKARAEKAGK